MTANVMRPCSHALHRGALVPTAAAALRLDDHAVHFGTAAFEAVRLIPTPRGPRLLAWTQHRERLDHSLRVLGLEPIPESRLLDALARFAHHNEVVDGYLRILAFADADCTRLDRSGAPTAFSILGWHTDHRVALPPLRLGIAAIRQPTTDAEVARAKLTGGYVLAAISHARARSSGFDDALKLHVDGTVCEATGANLFAVQDGRLLTPALRDSIDGTMRRMVVAMAESLRLETTIGPLPLDRLQAADEAFLTGTYFGISAVRAIEDRTLAAPAPGPVTTRLRETLAAWIDAPDSAAAQGWFEPLPDRAEQPTRAAAVRRAAIADLDAVLHAVQMLIDELRGTPSPLPEGARATCARWLESGEGGVVFAAGTAPFDGLLTLGFAEAIHAGGPVATIQELWVHQAARSSGVGAALVDAAAAEARRRGATLLEVGLPRFSFPSLPRTLAFYSQCGFDLLGPRMRRVLR
ncbi:MAG: GNAT family N-acetyltransferase [Planctomycetes bacterium]|nr:GNAT family N-acetyltransferase [Planctomycetota bacterium]